MYGGIDVTHEVGEVFAAICGGFVRLVTAETGHLGWRLL
jgi:hypothetical protein